MQYWFDVHVDTLHHAILDNPQSRASRLPRRPASCWSPPLRLLRDASSLVTPFCPLRILFAAGLASMQAFWQPYGSMDAGSSASFSATHLPCLLDLHLGGPVINSNWSFHTGQHLCCNWSLADTLDGSGRPIHTLRVFRIVLV
jgi:hypothetical protein